MIHTAVIVLTFLVIHIADFYYKAKFGHDIVAMIPGTEIHDLASLVVAKFKMPGFVIFYIASFILLGFHLIHGFQSAFKTLGWHNLRITPVIQVLSLVYTIVVVGGFTAIPLIIYFQ